MFFIKAFTVYILSLLLMEDCVWYFMLTPNVPGFLLLVVQEMGWKVRES